MHSQPSGPRSPAAAWQPFTWSGVAAFSRPAPVMWPVWVLGTALLFGAASERLVARGWLPAVDAALRNLPATGEIARGRLAWPTNGVAELGKTPFLALRVNPQSSPVPGQSADVEVEVSAGELSVRSLFGYWILPYPESLQLALNRPTLEPLWATWLPYVRPGVLAAAVGLACLSWALLGLLAAPVLRLLAATLRRQVTLGGCWRMAVVALLPGALLVTAALFLYADSRFRLVDFVFAFLLGHLLGAVLLVGAPWYLPRRVPSALFGAPAVFGSEEAVPAEDFTPATSSIAGRAVVAAPAVSPFAAPPESPPTADNPFAVASPAAEVVEDPRPALPPRPAPGTSPGPPPEEPLDEPLNPS